MVNEICEINVPWIYPEAIRLLKIAGQEEESRNGTVLAFQGPTLLTIHNPMERVIFDPIRDANPFFHLMEFIWMMSGSNDVHWIAQFNKRYLQYADGDIVHGAYGHRWINHFSSVDQITSVIDQLKKDRTSRRAVLGMWDPTVDLTPHNDLPCNTHIYFRVDKDDCLDMTVCNRSNDLIWGMLGANVVHMTMLQELIALGTGLGLGSYQVFSNNTHVYKNLPKYDEIIQTIQVHDPYTDDFIEPMSLLRPDEGVGDFLLDCYDFVKKGVTGGFRTYWMENVAAKVQDSWFDRTRCENIAAKDWRKACLDWVARRSSSSTSTER